MKKDLTITIGITAHNEAYTIGPLLRSLRDQKIPNGVTISEVRVITDGSTDKTTQIVKTFRSKHFKHIHFNNQLGKNSRLNLLIEETKADLLVLLDADIAPLASDTIAHLIKPFLLDANVGLAAGNPLPVRSKTLAGRASNNWILALVDLRKRLKSGNNPYSACGPILALSKKLRKNLVIPQNVPDDRFLYFANQARGLAFVYVPSAQVWFRSAETTTDLVNQGTRYQGNYIALVNHIGKDIVEKSFQLSLVDKLSLVSAQLTRDPLAYFYMKYTHGKILLAQKQQSLASWADSPSSKKMIFDI